MTDLGAGIAQDRLPASAWALGWVFLAGQVLQLLDRGVTRAGTSWALVSMVLSALLIAWFAAGVLRARPTRTFVVWLVMFIEVGLGLIAVVVPLVTRTSVSGSSALGFAAALVEIFTLAVYCRSDCYLQLREGGSTARLPSLAGILILAALVGALGGITSTGGDQTSFLHIGL